MKSKEQLIIERFKQKLDSEIDSKTNIFHIDFLIGNNAKGIFSDEDLIEMRGYYKGLKVARAMLQKSTDEVEESDIENATNFDEPCPFCDKAIPLVEGKTSDYGIAIHYPDLLIAYGYDVHGSNSNGLGRHINYCPMCGKKLIN